MATDLIRYDLRVQDALRGVVREVLTEAVRDGLPGEHHFYISFRTAAPGVRLSARMREQYPDEMTIILQHQFWDLSVTDYAFEVGLSFQGKAELLQIPFEALTGFFDPSVQFGLKFEIEPDAVAAGANDTGVEPVAVPAPAAEKPAMGTPFPKPRGSGTEPEEIGALRKDTDKNNKESEPGQPIHSNESKIVSIEAFRKKT
jgi:hypothetical protein